jgi:hypothetical protein
MAQGSFLHNPGVAGTPTTITLSGLPAHDTLSLDFLLAILDG